MKGFAGKQFTVHQVHDALNPVEMITLIGVRSSLRRLGEQGIIQPVGYLPVGNVPLRRPERLWARVGK